MEHILKYREAPEDVDSFEYKCYKPGPKKPDPKDGKKTLASRVDEFPI